MLFALMPPYRTGVVSDPEWMTYFARNAESMGFESVYAVEHVAVPANYTETYPYAESGRMPLANDTNIPDPLDLLGFLAAKTETLRLATGILVAPHHHPLILAKRLATIDQLSGGRLTIGVGVGWMREELEATGVQFESRGRRLDETLEALTAIWSNKEATHHGEFFDFDQAVSMPKPKQPGGVPIHIGGHSRAAARRAGRFGAGFQPLGLDPTTLADRLDEMAQTAAKHNRDADKIELTLGAGLGTFTAERAEELASLGADRVILSVTTADHGEINNQMWAVAPLIEASSR